MVSPAFLTIPEPGDRLYRGLQQKVRLDALGHLLRLSQHTPQLAPLAGPLTAAVRKKKGAVLAAVGAPDVLAPLLCHRGGLAPIEPVLDTAVPSLLVGLGHRGVLAESVLYTRSLPRVLDPITGWAYTPEDGLIDGIVADPAGSELRTPAGQLVRLAKPQATPPRAAGLHTTRTQAPIAPGLHLSLVDTNPLSHVEAHPDKAGNALSLGDRPLADWLEAFRAAVDALQAGLPEWVSALRQAPVRVVPVGFQPERHFSASYREAPGVAYLTLHPSTLTLAEALVHEAQHTRVNVLGLRDAILHNGLTAWTSSPVRPDLRPLHGVLLAVHAFVPVAVAHARWAAQQHPLALDPAFLARRAAVLVGNETGLRACQHKGEPTPAGARLLSALHTVHQATIDAFPGGLDGARSICASALPEGVVAPS